MKPGETHHGFSLIEVVVAIGIFLIFAVGIYSALTVVFKVVYSSRMHILETAILTEQLELVHNLAFSDVGISGGVPNGVLTHSKTVTRSGSMFTVLTTVRNVDDPYDGTLGGVPNDANPEDYKLVEMSAQCVTCVQQTPVILSTMVVPKSVEGPSTGGTLGISVLDANGQPVPQAAVHITNTTVIPNITIDDVTNNDGVLVVIDAPTSTLAYNITISKVGYSNDYTSVASQGNPNPTKPPASVEIQKVTPVSFSIDRVAPFTVATVSPDCGAIGTASFHLWGTKLVGTLPNIFKYDQTLATDGGGQKVLSNQEWDTYQVSTSGTVYDVAGTIPLLPLTLTPGSSEQLTLVLRAHTAHSLLVKVKDNGTGLPLSGANVTLSRVGFSQDLTTGVGYVRQTDWSGGSGQEMLTDETKYWSDDGGVAVAAPSGDITLRPIGNDYLANGWIESATFDLASDVTFANILVTPTAQPPAVGLMPVLAQLATATTSAPVAWDFVGPDGTATSYYTPTSTLIFNGHNDDRYVRYRLYLNTDDIHVTPQVSDVAITYTNTCTPPGQAFFINLVSGTYTIQVDHAGYDPTNGQIDVVGTNETTVNVSPL